MCFGSDTRIVQVADVPRTRSGKLADSTDTGATAGSDDRRDSAGNVNTKHDRVAGVTDTTLAPRRHKITRLPYKVAVQRRYVPGDGWESHVPRLLSWACYFVAVIAGLTAVFPILRRTLRPVRDLVDIVFVVGPPNLAWAVLMVILASSLAKRKRAAWGFLVLLEVVETSYLCLLVLNIPDVFPAILVPMMVNLSVIGILLLARREFFAIVQQGNGWRALATFAIGLLCSIVIGFIILTFLVGSLDRLQRAPYVVHGFFDILTNGAEGTGRIGVPRQIAWVIGLLGSLTFIATASVFFRPRNNERMIHDESEVEVRELVAEYGERDSLAYFATRRDKSGLWSPNLRAVVTYRVVMGVSLASADPVGDPAAWPQAIEVWLEEARRHAWAPAAIGASKEGAEAYERAGLAAIELGDEAILEFRDFQLEGRHMRAVRQAINRVERAGYTARVRRHYEVPEDEMARAIAAADTWRDTDNERGFSMALGRLGDPCDGHCVLAEVFDGEGKLAALLSFSPWGEKGLSLDLMRRSRSSENGVIEFMVAALVAAGPHINAERVSLNFAVLRGVFAEGERIGAGPVVRAIRGVLLFFSRWWQLESLYLSNEKYAPDWVPRYLMYEKTGDLLRVSIAAGIAEGFVVIPNLKAWITRKSGAAGSPLIKANEGSPVELMAAADARRAEQAAARKAELEANPYQGLPEQERIRRQKLAALRERGIDPYATSFRRTTTIGAIRTTHGELAPDTKTGAAVSIAGRVMLNRVTGKLCFASLRDWTGDIQLMISLDVSGEEVLRDWKTDVDLGDIVGVNGEIVTSKRGELSVFVESFAITSKCLVPLPDKHKGLTDPEARVRQRYVDLIVNPPARRMLSMRSEMVRAIRESLWRRGFLEVETPMLASVHGGAVARPFKTHINAYDMDLYLRIAPELFLKRLLVGGAEKVFELNRSFRNEGTDATHNPEFTSMEMYDAYGDYDTMRELTRELICEAAVAVHGKPVAWRPTGTGLTGTGGQGPHEEVDISGEWPVITVYDAISNALGEEVTPDTEFETLARLCERANIARKPEWGAPQLILEMYEHLGEARTTTPTFYTDFPTEVSPLTRKKPSDPRVAERWDLVAWGAEIGTAYTELIDPIDQRARLVAQSLLAAAGDLEAMEVDDDFLRALEYGMPPAGGQGMGIDRLIMMLTGSNIRETMLFPLTKPDGF